MVTTEEKVVPIGPLRQPVLSLVAVRESRWVGTSGDGLGLVVPGTTEVIAPPDVVDQPALRAPIVALALVRDTLVVITPDQFAWRDPATRRWTLQRARAELGRVTALAGDAGGVWIGGTNGLAFWDIPHTTFRTLAVPLDLPSAVRDVAVDRSYVWVATDSGLVRLARDAALR